MKILVRYYVCVCGGVQHNCTPPAFLFFFRVFRTGTPVKTSLALKLHNVNVCHSNIPCAFIVPVVYTSNCIVCSSSLGCGSSSSDHSSSATLYSTLAPFGNCLFEDVIELRCKACTRVRLVRLARVRFKEVPKCARFRSMISR